MLIRNRHFPCQCSHPRLNLSRSWVRPLRLWMQFKPSLEQRYSAGLANRLTVKARIGIAQVRTVTGSGA